MPRKTFRFPFPIVRPLVASMRPRPDAAENLPACQSVAAGDVRRFNEAAARCRGKLWTAANGAGTTRPLQ